MAANDKNPREKIIARAWKDPAFKKKLQSDPAAALKEMGYKFSANTKVRFMEDNSSTFTFVLPTAPEDMSGMGEEELEWLAGGVAVGRGSTACDCHTPQTRCPPWDTTGPHG